MVPLFAFLFAGPLIARFGPGAVIAAGCAIFAAGAAWWGLAMGLTPDYVGDMLGGMLLTGIGVGLTMPTFTATGAAALPAHSFATGSGMINMLRQIGLAVGVAVLIAVLGTPHGPSATLASYEQASYIIAGLSIAAGVAALALLLEARAGDRERARRHRHGLAGCLKSARPRELLEARARQRVAAVPRRPPTPAVTLPSEANRSSMTSSSGGPSSGAAIQTLEADPEHRDPRLGREPRLAARPTPRSSSAPVSASARPASLISSRSLQIGVGGDDRLALTGEGLPLAEQRPARRRDAATISIGAAPSGASATPSSSSACSPTHPRTGPRAYRRSSGRRCAR